MCQSRSAVLVVALLLSIFAARRAEACGAWGMNDLERKLLVSWQTSRATIRNDVPHGKQVAELEVSYESGELELLDAHGRAIVTANGHAVMHRGAQVGSVDGADVKIGEHRFTISIEPTGKVDEVGDDQSFFWFTVKVTIGDRKIVTSDAAVGLCAAHEPASSAARDHQRAEIEARVLAYLGWRETEK